MSSEEEDYMSDAFLAKTVEDVRPGLVKNRAKVRENEILAKKARLDEETRQRYKPLKHLEAERRDEGLSSAISSDNKGFAMLAKMGYKQGDAIGRSSQGGIVEPIGIQIKIDRGGLGREAALQQLQERRNEIRRQKLLAHASKKDVITTEEFRRRNAQRAGERQIEADLGKCQRACEKLDLEESIDTPAIAWFWPIRKSSQDSENEANSEGEAEGSKEEQNVENVDAEEDVEDKEDEEDEIEYESSEKLEMISNYLRTTYCYCHWCGTKYDGADDMKDNCPGLTKDDH